LGDADLLNPRNQSPIITASHNPKHPDYDSNSFYHRLKSKEFVIYPGKVTEFYTFRSGTIGHIFQDTIKQLIKAVQTSMHGKRSIAGA